MVDGSLVFYNEDGNCIEVFLTRDPHYAVWINSGLTVYRSHATNEVVGVQIECGAINDAVLAANAASLTERLFSDAGRN